MLDRVSTAFGQIAFAAFSSSPKSSALIFTVTDVVRFPMHLSWPLRPFAGKESSRCKASVVLHLGTMREYALFLRLLASRLLNAHVSTGARIIDASDFKVWLMELSQKAETAATLEDFFNGV
jgi:hypothetical protein